MKKKNKKKGALPKNLGKDEEIIFFYIIRQRHQRAFHASQVKLQSIPVQAQVKRLMGGGAGNA
jgi:hypothetical protein